MTPVLYILECSLTSLQQWEFKWYKFNNVHSFNRDISDNRMHNIAYTIHTLYSTYYYYIVHTDVTDAYFLHECNLLQSNDP